MNALINNQKAPPAVAEAIERQRTRVFRALALVETTEISFRQDACISQRETLKAASELLDDIAGKLELIEKYGSDGDDVDEGGAS